MTRRLVTLGVALLGWGAAVVGIGAHRSDVRTAHAARGSATTPDFGFVAPAPAHAPRVVAPLIDEFCLDCHDKGTHTAGLVLETFDADHPEKNPEVAEKVIRKLRLGLMPPPDNPRPEPAAVKTFVNGLETKIDQYAALHPNPGVRPFQRLNRAEYARSIHDLLALDVDVDAYLPPDTISHGFDNVADVQGFSPAMMEGYLRAASAISRLAVGDPKATPTTVTYKIPRTASQLGHVDGTPYRHARRHLRRPHVPGRRHLRLQDRDARDADRRSLRIDDAWRAARGLGQRHARRAARYQPAHERRRSDGHEPLDGAHSGEGRTAADFRGVSPPLRGTGRRSHRADRAHAGRHPDRFGAGRDDAAARARLRRHGTVQGDGRLGHAEPPGDFHLSSRRRRDATRRAEVRRGDSPAAVARGLSASGDTGRGRRRS